METEENMLKDVLVFLKDHLNQNLRPGAALAADNSVEETVVFVDGDKMDPVTFKSGAVSVLLINVEEENTLRRADRFVGVGANGEAVRINPDIRMNLYVLFVARYKDYETGLSQLSRIVGHFQNHRVFDRQNAPELAEEIEKLTLELITLPLSEQNDLWNALRTAYHPSVLYKVGTIIFRDADGRAPVELSEKAVQTSQ